VRALKVLIWHHWKMVKEAQHEEAPLPEDSDDPFGIMKDEIEIVGDVLGPAIPAEDWESLYEPETERDGRPL